MYLPDEEEINQDDIDNDGEKDDQQRTPQSLKQATHATDPNIINK